MSGHEEDEARVASIDASPVRNPPSPKRRRTNPAASNPCRTAPRCRSRSACRCARRWSRPASAGSCRPPSRSPRPAPCAPPAPPPAGSWITARAGRGDEVALGRVGAVGEDLAHHRQPISRAMRSWWPRAMASTEARLDRLDRPAHRSRDLGVGLREIAQCAMRLDVGDGVAGIGRERHRRPDLVGDQPLDLPRAVRDHPPPEAGKVGIAGVGAHRDAIGLRGREGAGHHLGIAGMETAGDIGGGHDLEDRGVVADPPRAEPLAHVGG